MSYFIAVKPARPLASDGDTTGEDGGDKEAVTQAQSKGDTGGLAVEEEGGCERRVICASLNEAIKKFLDLLEGVDSLFFHSGHFFGWIRIRIGNTDPGSGSMTVEMTSKKEKNKILY
jgi:hypothetical protein